MSPLDPQLPPVGEEIHVSKPSIMPLLLAAGLAVALVGVTISLILVIGGGALSLAVAYRWIRSTRSEFDELPPS